jgi:EAL domain-containing protein (putative c-di-GMP-specific phosphodiesterase class I)
MGAGKRGGELASRHRLPGMAHLSVNVNISGHDLSHPDFADNVLDVPRRHSVAPNLLTLEITESVLMDQLDLARAKFGRLRTRGVELAIDDFGTGSSSLAYLGKLPVDCLKIDCSLAMGTGNGSEDSEIVRAVLMLGCAPRPGSASVDAPCAPTRVRRCCRTQ